MPDITMCPGEECPIKNTCFRYKCIPDTYQSYFVHAPFQDGKCEKFMDIPEKKNKPEGK